MELKVYDGEYFERNKTWYIVFAFIILLVVVLSVLSSNIIWWVFVLIVAGGYIYFLTKTNDTIKMIIWEKWLQIGKVVFLWNNLSGFVLEYHTEKKKIHNIVIIDDKNIPRIYTIKDTQKNLEGFVKELSEHVSMLDKYEQSTMDKFIRKLKL